MKRYFEYKRQINGDPFCTKGGRPRKAVEESRGPGQILNESDELDNFGKVTTLFLAPLTNNFSITYR